MPSPSISTSTVSPSRRKRPWAAPTPAGVPVAMMSPGSSVIVRESHATSSAGPKIRFAVVPSCSSLAVDARAQAERAQVADLVERDERGAARRERVDRLAARPQRVLQLQVARADVVERHRAGDVRQGVRVGDVARRTADHERQLRLVVDVVGVRGRQHDRLAAAAQRVCELREPHRRRRDVLPGLLGVVAVVQADADDLLGVGDRRAQLHVGQPNRLGGGGVGGTRGQIAQAVRVQFRQQATHTRGCAQGRGRHEALAHQDRRRGLLATREADETHRAQPPAPVSLGLASARLSSGRRDTARDVTPRLSYTPTHVPRPLVVPTAAVTAASASMHAGERMNSIAPDGEPITPAGLVALEAEIEELETTGRRAMAARILAARELGDLSENADYHIAKEDQAHLETRIKRLRQRRANALIVEADAADAAFGFGSTAEVLDEESGTVHTWTIVGSTEADLAQGKLSAQSPVAAALLGRGVGESVAVRTPRGVRSYRVQRLIA